MRDPILSGIDLNDALMKYLMKKNRNCHLRVGDVECIEHRREIVIDEGTEVAGGGPLAGQQGVVELQVGTIGGHRSHCLLLIRQQANYLLALHILVIFLVVLNVAHHELPRMD